MPINFVANKLWTFRAVRHHVPDVELPLLAPVVAAELVDETGHVEDPLHGQRSERA